jgi:hypothetical protein
MFNPNQAFLLVQKLKSSPKGFMLGVKAEYRNDFFNLPQVTNKCWTLWPCIGPKAEKGIPSNSGSQFVTLGTNLPAFITILTSMLYHLSVNLGPNNKPKMLKIGPEFFGHVRALPNCISKMPCTILFGWRFAEKHSETAAGGACNLETCTC